MADGGMHARINIFSGLSIQALFSYGRIDGLFGLNQREIISGKLITLYTIGSIKKNKMKKLMDKKLTQKPTKPEN